MTEVLLSGLRTTPAPLESVTAKTGICPSHSSTSSWVSAGKVSPDSALSLSSTEASFFLFPPPKSPPPLETPNTFDKDDGDTDDVVGAVLERNGVAVLYLATPMTASATPEMLWRNFMVVVVEWRRTAKI